MIEKKIKKNNLTIAFNILYAKADKGCHYLEVKKNISIANSKYIKNAGFYSLTCFRSCKVKNKRESH